MNTNTLEFQKIFEDFQPKILRYLARLVGDSDAEDLTQETFVTTPHAQGRGLLRSFTDAV
jgi:DNA-directed RNA polymerase specialized sigma24 family protein